MFLNTNLKLIDLSEVLRLTTYSRSQLYRLERVGKFPPRLQIGARRVAWVEREVRDWITQKIESRNELCTPLSRGHPT